MSRIRVLATAPVVLLAVLLGACGGGTSGADDDAIPRLEEQVGQLEFRIADLEQELAELRQRIVSPTAASWTMRTDDVRAEAEAYLTSPLVAAVAGTEFLEARCPVADDLDVGDVIECEGDDATGLTWDLEVELTSPTLLTLRDGAPRD